MQATEAGNFSLAPGCADAASRPSARNLQTLDFSIEGQQQRWCVETLLPASTEALSALDGAWYAPADPGWGLFSHFYPDSNGMQNYHSLYYHDASGQPRWSFAQQAVSGFEQNLTFFNVRGSCLGCAVQAGSTTAAGPVQLRQASVQLLPSKGNRIVVSISPGEEAPFVRTADLQLLSTPVAITAVASTREGLVQGQRLADGSEAYFNLPYVAPPVADLRWRAPQPAAARGQVLATLVPGPGVRNHRASHCFRPSQQAAAKTV